MATTNDTLRGTIVKMSAREISQLEQSEDRYHEGCVYVYVVNAAGPFL